MATKKLPTYQKFIIDTRLRQFRSFDKNHKLIIIGFETKEGKKLLKEISINGFTTK